VSSLLYKLSVLYLCCRCSCYECLYPCGCECQRHLHEKDPEAHGRQYTAFAPRTFLRLLTGLFKSAAETHVANPQPLRRAPCNGIAGCSYRSHPYNCKLTRRAHRGKMPTTVCEQPPWVGGWSEFVTMRGFAAPRLHCKVPMDQKTSRACTTPSSDFGFRICALSGREKPSLVEFRQHEVP